MTAWDRSAIVLLGAAGFLFSYDALRQIAVAIHARESLSYLFPIFIDGFIAYGVRAIVLLRHERFSARLYAWVLFLAATGASLGANALHAITLNRGPQAGRSALHLTDGVVGVLSTLAPLALAGSVHLYILMARTAELSSPDGEDHGPGPVREEVLPVEENVVRREIRPAEAIAETEPSSPAASPSGTSASAPALVSLQKDEVVPIPVDAHEEPSVPPSAPAPVDAHEKPSVPDEAEHPQDREADDEWLKELLPIAQAATEQAGRISREVVAVAIRPHHAISNDRLGLLLARLRDAAEQPTQVPAAASSSLW